MSDEYIKREGALDIVADNNVTGEITLNRYDKIIDGIYDIPSADVEPVVRCKDCKCWTEWANGTGSCSRFALDWIGTDSDDFCSMGERKDEEADK